MIGFNKVDLPTESGKYLVRYSDDKPDQEMICLFAEPTKEIAVLIEGIGWRDVEFHTNFFNVKQWRLIK